MITVEINGKKVQAENGDRILDVVRQAGFNVPTLCNIKDLLPTGACRMCVVEVEGYRNLVPSCAHPASDGMKIETHSERAVEARKMITELLLADHPEDCNYCKRNGACELQDLASELWVRQRRFGDKREKHKLDVSSPSLVRDPDKCILCGRCVRVCEEVQTVSCIDFIGRGSKTIVGTAFDEGLNVSSCVNCGQCIMVCPTGALSGRRHIEKVRKALHDPKKHVVVQHAPAISVTLAEEFGVKPGSDINGKMTAALRTLGFKRVFDTSFTADLTIMEEASELVKRIKEGGALPMMTSCSPAWIKFVEQFYPDMVDNLSTCKSPQQMMGAVIKHYYAQKNGINPEDVFVVSVMPCVAKKFEAARPEMNVDGIPDVDAVINTRELAQLIKMRGIDIHNIEPDHADTPFGERSTAGKLFGASGGVMEAALRTANFMLTGSELDNLDIKPVRGLKGVKQATVEINGLSINVAVASGLGNARNLLEEMRAGIRDIHFLEVMSCPGGCINGGGQPISCDSTAITSRMKALYKLDKESTLRVSHKNEAVQRLYDEFLGEPLGEKSHKLLHTHYHKREVTV
jgi:iron-only hydrogenase group A